MVEIKIAGIFWISWKVNNSKGKTPQALLANKNERAISFLSFFEAY
jgi:hypothetical protein